MAERVIHIKRVWGIEIQVPAHLGPEKRTDRAEGKEANLASRDFFNSDSDSETGLEYDRSVSSKTLFQ